MLKIRHGINIIVNQNKHEIFEDQQYLNQQNNIHENPIIYSIINSKQKQDNFENNRRTLEVLIFFPTVY